MPPRYLLAALLAWGGASAAQSTGHYFERGMRMPGVESGYELGDVDGDGLKDFFWIEFDRDAADNTEWRDRVYVMRQLPGGHFDLPRQLYACACALRSLVLFQADNDPGQEVAFESRDGYFASGAQFTVIDPSPPFSSDGVPHAIYIEPAVLYSEIQALDLDLDGVDELFFITESQRFGPDGRSEFRVITYKSDRKLGFARSQGPGFARPGDRPFRSGHDTNPNRQYVDMDLDGIRDVMFDVCPQACLYRHDPDGMLRLESVLEQPGGLEPDSVDAPPARSLFVDLDEDGLHDRVVWWLGGASLRIDLQTSKLNFKAVAELPLTDGLTVGQPDVADVDNNGLLDVIYADEYYLLFAMQREPGLFTLERLRFESGMHFRLGGQVKLADLNGDGCMDAVMTTGEMWYFRGRGCDAPSDLAVALTPFLGHFEVSLEQDDGPREFPGTVVRVLVSPMSGPEGPATPSYTVTAPAGCLRVPAREPRQIYDCRADLSPARRAEAWRFDFGAKAGRIGWETLQVAAFVLGGPADANPGNNHVRARLELVHRTTQRATPGSGLRQTREAAHPGKRPARTGGRP